MLAKWLGGKATITPTEEALLDSVREVVIPDPAVLRDRLASLNTKIAATEAEWKRLDRLGDPSAFLAATEVAERLQRSRAEAATLLPQIEAAERQRGAFLALARWHEAITADEAASLSLLLEQPPQDARERDRVLRELDRKTRLRSRIAGRLASVSSSPLYRDPADALGTLRKDLEARIRECDRLRVPGMRPALTMPPAVVELLDAMEGQRRKETA